MSIVNLQIKNKAGNEQNIPNISLKNKEFYLTNEAINLLKLNENISETIKCCIIEMEIDKYLGDPKEIEKKNKEQKRDSKILLNLLLENQIKVTKIINKLNILKNNKKRFNKKNSVIYFKELENLKKENNLKKINEYNF